MKRPNSPRKLLWIGIVFVVLGFLLPLILVLGVIENSFALSLLAYLFQLVGLILGVVYAAGAAMDRREKDEVTTKSKQEEQESQIGWME